MEELHWSTTSCLHEQACRLDRSELGRIVQTRKHRNGPAHCRGQDLHQPQHFTVAMAGLDMVHYSMLPPTL